MISHFTINKTQMVAQEVEEQGSFVVRGALNNYLLDHLAARIEDMSVTILRNIGDDTYNLTVTKPPIDRLAFLSTEFRDKAPGSITSLNINNKFTSSSATYGKNASYIEQIHRSLFDSLTLAKTDLINILWQWDSTGVEDAEPELLASITIKPTLMPLTSSFHVANNECLVFKLIDEIRLSFRQGESSYVGTINSQSSPDIAPYLFTKTHSFIAICPHTISQACYTQNIADIYAFNENGANLRDDFAINDIAYHSLSFAASESNAHLVFANKSTPFTYQSANSTFTGQALHIGQVYIDQIPIIGYDNGKTQRGIAEDAEMGELIPHDFVGTFERDLAMSLNATNRHTHFHFLTHVNQPYLDPESGIVQMSIANINASDRAKELGTIDNHLLDIDAIRELRTIIVKEKTFVPLIGLERRSSHA